MTYVNFGERLAALRKEKNISQLKLANELFVTRKTIHDWEYNYVLPNYDSIITLAYTLNVSADYLLGLTDEKRHLHE